MNPENLTQPNMQQDPTQLPIDDSVEMGDMTPEEMTNDLTELMQAIDQRMNTINGAKVKMEGDLTIAQNKAIEDLFKMLQENGVDLNDPNAVGEFLKQLEQDNPEGYKIFEDAINNLLSQKEIQNKMMPPDGFAEPLNKIEQQAVLPPSPMGPDQNLPVNELTPVPGLPGNN